MRYLTRISLLVFCILLVTACTDSESAVRKTVEEAAQAAENGLNRRNLSAVEPYFATVEEGAIAAGLDETERSPQSFLDSLTSSDRVQFHSFDVQSVAMHENGGLARVTYRLHLSVIRNSEVFYSAVVTQDIALLKTARGWRISGGDTPQLSEVSGEWPPH